MNKIPLGRFGFVTREGFDWIKTHWTTVATAAVVVVVGAITLNRWMKGGSQGDFLVAETTYRSWTGGKDAGFEQLQKILKTHPELHARYDGAIAQKLLSKSENGLAKIYGKATLKRIGQFSPYYENFTKTTFLIGDGAFSEALEQAKQLNIALESDDAFWSQSSEIVKHGSILYAYNLLRIGMLEGAAGSPAGELAAWKRLKESAGWGFPQPITKMYNAEAYRLLEENFQNQAVSLRDYIQYREEAITSELSR